MFGCLMEQGGEKKTTMQELPARPLQTKGSSFQDWCSAWFTNKEKPTVLTPQACTSAFGNSSTGAGAMKEPKPLAPLASFLPRCSHDLTLTPPHLGKAVPMSHKNTPRESHPALDYLKASNPATARAAENRPDTGTSKGCWKARNSPSPALSHWDQPETHPKNILL